MKLIEEARVVDQEIQEKLDQITTLTTQARKLLLDHGQPIPDERNFWDKLLYGLASPATRDKYPILYMQMSRKHKQISRQIDGIEVQIFSIAGIEETLPIVVSIPISGKSLALKGEKSIAQDEINNPGSPKSLSRISLDDLNAWGVVIQSVEDSLRFNQ